MEAIHDNPAYNVVLRGKVDVAKTSLAKAKGLAKGQDSHHVITVRPQSVKPDSDDDSFNLQVCLNFDLYM